jgi:FtsX-like permease family
MLRRSLLIVAMVALPVMLVTAVATIARTSLSTPEERALWEALTVVAGALALFMTGLIAAAAFVVGARRQLRELGLVGAVGGERRHVLAVVLLGGTTLGLAGSLLGALLGILVAYLSHPLLDDLVGHAIGPVQINYGVVIGTVAMGTGAATLAALAPARAAAKLSTVDALAGRSRAPQPPGRIAGAGLVVVVAGGALTAWGTRTDHDLLLAGGLIAMLSGFLLSIPLLVVLVGRSASRLPVTGRLAARDAARHGRRTGAAVAAAAIALSVPVAFSTYSSSVETFKRRTPLGHDQLLIGQLEGPDARNELVGDLEQEFPQARIVALDSTTAEDFGLQEYEAAFLMTAPDLLSSRDIERASDVSTDHPGASITSADDYLPRYALLRTTATATSLPLALAIVAVAVALVASESRRSRQILVAVGADQMSHRMLLAATSSLLALIAAVLAIPAGLLPMVVVWTAADQSGLPLVIPWMTIGILIFLVPLLAALVGGLAARTPKLGSLLSPAT